MPKQSKGKRKVQGSQVPQVKEEQTVGGSPSAEEQPVVKKKSTYNPATAKAYRERLMEYAKKGGYEPKPKAEGTGLTEKRTSKTGTTYYYQPWSSLTDEQKKTRLAQARERAARDREMARLYREEHPKEKTDEAGS